MQTFGRKTNLEEGFQSRDIFKMNIESKSTRKRVRGPQNSSLIIPADIQADDEKFEEFIWNLLDKQSISVEYEAGIPGSLFNKDAKYTSWTPNHLGGILDTLRLSTLHSKGKIKEIEGITTPYLYRGNPGTAFGLHFRRRLVIRIQL